MITATVFGVAAAPASGQTVTRCNDIFPGVPWESVEGLTVDLGVVGVPEGQVDRFRDEVETSAASISADIGGLEGSAVCIVGKGVELDMTSYVGETMRFHAIIDGPQNFLALSSEQIGDIKPAAAFGIAQLALWNLSNGEGWPEPLASTIAHWYRAVALDRLEIYHKQAQGADFRVNSLTGEASFGLDFSTEPRIDWFESRQPPIRVWDPSKNEFPIGDFIEYTVAQEGTGVLLDTVPEDWVQREGAWRVALVQDLTGRTTPTTAWRIGVGFIVVVVVIATIVAVAGFMAKRRRTLHETPPPVPGFFSSTTKE
jgi:hypothetical protein